MASKGYQDLAVWQRAMDLVVACYAATKSFPKSEAFGLTSQLQRAAVSVPANIAAGQGRQHRAEFIQHLSIAYGSLNELETHMQIAQRLDYITIEETKQLLDQTNRIGRLLNGLRRSLHNTEPPPLQYLTDHQLATDNQLPTTAN